MSQNAKDSRVPGLYGRYQQQGSEIAGRLGQIRMEIEGMKIKIEHTVQKIRVLDTKLKALNKD